MPRYDWYNRYYIESRLATYDVYDKRSGRPIYNGKADDAFYRLAENCHPYFCEGTYVVVTYYHGNTNKRTLLEVEANTITNARLPRKNIQNNPTDIRYCRHHLCRNTI